MKKMARAQHLNDLFHIRFSCMHSYVKAVNRIVITRCRESTPARCDRGRKCKVVAHTSNISRRMVQIMCLRYSAEASERGALSTHTQQRTDRARPQVAGVPDAKAKRLRCETILQVFTRRRASWTKRTVAPIAAPHVANANSAGGGRVGVRCVRRIRVARGHGIHV